MTTLEQSVDPADRALARPAGPRPLTSSRAARTRRMWYEIVGLTAPAAIVFALFVIVPIGFAVYYSLYKWNGIGPPTQFRGLDNYFGPYGAFKDKIFQDALKNNAIILVGSLVVQGPLALAIALLLNRRFKGRALFRALVFAPYVIAEVTVGIMWELLLARRGAIDTLFTDHGGHAPGFLSDPHIIIWTMLAILTWKYLGLALILFLAGLQNVPEELGEAAAIDGASWWQIQRHVTIPLLGPTIRIWAFLSMIGSLQVFDVVWVASASSMRSLGATDTMATYMIDHGFFSREWGYGNAIAVILFAIAFVAALLIQRFLLRRDIDGAVTGRVN